MNTNIYNFHLPWRKTITMVVLFICAILVWKSYRFFNIYIAIIIFLNIFAPLLGVWFISTIRISNEGIVLYRVNKLVWSDIVETYKYNFFGLPYIRIKRKKGMHWWLPLYFIGENTIKEALLKYVPQNNSLHETASVL